MFPATPVLPTTSVRSVMGVSRLVCAFMICRHKTKIPGFNFLHRESECIKFLSADFCLRFCTTQRCLLGGYLV